MSAPTSPISPQNQLLIDAAEAALRSLSDVAAEQENWKPVLTHRTGAVVYRTNKVPKGQIAVFKGVAVIHGFTPDAIFPLIKNRQLWDNWYLDGHVVDHVNENISLSYMVMKPQTALTRDLALVDRTAFSPSTGTIAYASTSVDTAKIPKHPGRVRALLKLNGWVLEPQIAADGRSLGTKISYYIQTDVGGMLPGSVVKRYLARRALVVVGVEDYLRKHGAPPPSGEADSAFLRRATMLINPNDESYMHYGSDRTSSFNGSKRGTLMSDASAPVARAATATTPAKTERPAPMVRAATTIASAPAAPAPAGPLPVVPRPTYVPHRHTESGVKALKYLKTLTTSDAWKHHSDQHGVSISTIDEPGSTMPIVRGDATFPAEFSVDDVISVIRCNGARKIWDARFEHGETVEWLNPNELVFKSQQKGQFPVSGRDFAGLQVTIFDARSATTYVVATSVVDALAPVDPKRVRAELTVAGWIVKPAPEGGVAVTYVVKVDPRGSIPGAIVKAVSIQTPLCVAEVLKYLRANGAPPAVK
ncbi:hypothetical protein BDZ88DRAFT_391166, partial [Geranomyces variabilis]